jgi:hypothetical protein
MSYAASLVDRLTSVADQLNKGARDRLQQVHRVVQAALMFFRPGGLFASYAHFDPDGIPPLAGSGGASVSGTEQGDDTSRSQPDSGPALQIIEDVDWVDIGGVILQRRKPGS